MAATLAWFPSLDANLMEDEMSIGELAYQYEKSHCIETFYKH